MKASDSKRYRNEASVRMHQSLGYCIGPRDDYMRRELMHMYVCVRGYVFNTAGTFKGSRLKTLPSYSLLASVHKTHLQSSLTPTSIWNKL